MPRSIASGSRKIAFHQSEYSSQCAVGVTHSSCALSSDHRWLDSRMPRAWPSAAARIQPVTPPIFMTSGIMKSDAPASIACCMSSVPHQFSPHWIGVRASRAISAWPA
jgi:hypothetical protein